MFMTNRLTDTCARELESHIEGLFKTAALRRTHPRGAAEIPVIGGRFWPYADHSFLLLRVCKALCAREHFRQDAPAWAPILPLRWEDCKEMEDDDDHRLNLVGLFGKSLYGELWDPQHPPFATFASGLLAYGHTPDELRNDSSLRQEFPPRPLEGLCDGNLNWRTPETIAQDREMLARIAAYEAAMAQEHMGV
jgi:hypothetical protein